MASKRRRVPVSSTSSSMAFCLMKSIGLLLLSLTLLSWSGVTASAYRIDIELSSEKEPALDRALDRMYGEATAVPPRFLSINEIKTKFSPSARRVAKVRRFLSKQGIRSRVDASGLFISAETDDVGLSMLETGVPKPFKALSVADSGSFSLPAPIGLESDIQGLQVSDLSRIPAKVRRVSPEKPPQPLSPVIARALSAESAQPDPYSSMLSNTGTPSGCPEALATGALTPNQWQTAYGLDLLYAEGIRGQGERIALIELEGQWVTPEDIRQYADCFGLKNPRYSLNVSNGGPLPNVSGGEAAGDMAIALAAAPEAEIDLWLYTGTSTAFNTQIAETLSRAIFGTKASHRPTVVSLSYGFCEAELALRNLGLSPRAMSVQLERLFKRLALAGISVLVAAGDQGASSCRQNPSENITSASYLLNVGYPASSPWVTAVGGTNLLLSSSNQLMDEIVWNDNLATLAYNQMVAGEPFDPAFFDNIGAGTGGVSSLFEAPRYQARIIQTVSNQLQLAIKNRVVPDISAMADPGPGYVYPINGVWSVIGGTSLSTPLTAGGVALMNQQLRQAKKKRLGFLNPTLYRMIESSRGAGVIRDVTLGHNDTGPQIFYAGTMPGPLLLNPYPPLGCCTAQAGFDPASGWGSINYSRFSNYLLGH